LEELNSEIKITLLKNFYKLILLNGEKNIVEGAIFKKKKRVLKEKKKVFFFILDKKRLQKI
jgi:hypothetical protein